MSTGTRGSTQTMHPVCAEPPRRSSRSPSESPRRDPPRSAVALNHWSHPRATVSLFSAYCPLTASADSPRSSQFSCDVAFTSPDTAPLHLAGITFEPPLLGHNHASSQLRLDSPGARVCCHHFTVTPPPHGTPYLQAGPACVHCALRRR